jgi:hypothetical protein
MTEHLGQMSREEQKAEGSQDLRPQGEEINLSKNSIYEMVIETNCRKSKWHIV